MRRGFTLIELLIVIAVISILIGIALPRFRGMQVEGNIVKAKSEVRTLQTAIESIKINTGTYPPTTTAICATYLNSASPLIVADVLYDPFRGDGMTYEYRYRRSTNRQYYVVYSYGPDGAQDITGINNSGVLQGTNDDDIYATNGSGF